MIQDTVKTFEVKSNLMGERVEMGIDASATAHIMNQLANLYSDTEMAPLRELSTNARDSHIEAGKAGVPIEISLPTSLRPFLTVKDYGVGMNAEDIRNVYSLYGASTKRETNDQIGCLGFGCKSPLTYTSQFTLVGIKDGIRTQVVISRSDDGSGSMTIVEETPTDEANGVEIVVPAQRYNNFQHKAQRLFQYWERGTVLVNGQEPQPLIETEYAMRLSDGLYVIEASDTVSAVVMGGVPYPAEISHGMDYGYSLVAFVKMGSVDFTPSREALMQTLKTQATLGDIEADFQNLIPTAIQEKIDVAKDKHEAIKIRGRWNRIWGSRAAKEDYTYQGEIIPTKFKLDVPDGTDQYDNSRYFYTSHFHAYAAPDLGSYSQVNADRFQGHVWIYDWEFEKITPTKRKKIQAWVDGQNDIAHINSFVFLKDKPDAKYDGWIPANQIVSWEEISKIKLPRAAPGTRVKIPGSFHVFEPGETTPTRDFKADKIAEHKHEVFYYQGNKWETKVYVDIIQKHYPKALIVCVALNRLAKFKRDFPKAREASAEVMSLVQDWVKSIKADEKLALAVRNQYYATPLLRIMDPKRVQDPKIKDAISIAKRDLTRIDEGLKMYGRFLSTPTQNAITASVKWSNPLDQYPLLNNAYVRDISKDKTLQKHVYTYINAIHGGKK